MKRTINFYDGEIAYVDGEIGQFMEELKKMNLEQDTLVVITSDHGEGLMDHGHMYHGIHIYEEQVRVPLMFRWSGRIPEGRTISGPAGLIDLAPTILDLIGMDYKSFPFQGKSLARHIIDGSTVDSMRPVYLHRRHYKGDIIGMIHVKGQKFSVIVGSWKFIEGPEEKTWELFAVTRESVLTCMIDSPGKRLKWPAFYVNGWIPTRNETPLTTRSARKILTA